MEFVITELSFGRIKFRQMKVVCAKKFPFLPKMVQQFIGGKVGKNRPRKKIQENRKIQEIPA
jgi:hypothetical protein